MLRLLQLELIKMKRSSFMKLLLVIMVIIISGFFYYASVKQQSYESELELVKQNQEISKFFYNDLQTQVDDLEAGEKFIDAGLSQRLSESKIVYEAQTKMVDALARENWEEYLEAIIESSVLEEKRAYQELERVFNSYTYPTPFTILSNLDRYKWMIENEVIPLFPTYPIPYITVYDEEFLDDAMRTQYKARSNVYSTVGVNFTFDVMKSIFTIAGLLILLFFFGDVLTKEGIDRNGPINLVRTQPIKRWKFWLSKYVTVTLGSASIVIGLVAICIGLSMIFDRFGDLHYPILIYGENRTYEFMPIALFLIKAFGLFMLFVMLTFSLHLLFSLITNKAIISIALTAIVLIGGTMFAAQSTLLSFSHWLPLHYVNIYEVLSGLLAVQMDNFHYSYSQAIISVSLSIVIILAITLVVAKLKKARG